MLNDQDWLTRFKESIPESISRDMLICNLPETNLSRKLSRGEVLNATERKQRKEESTNDVFVFAGFIAPGKHQIIIKD